MFFLDAKRKSSTRSVQKAGPARLGGVSRAKVVQRLLVIMLGIVLPLEVRRRGSSRGIAVP